MISKIVNSIVLQFLLAIIAGPWFYVAGFFLPKRKFVIGSIETANVLHSLSKVFPDSFTVNFLTNKFYRNNKYDFGPYRFVGSLISPLILLNLIPRANNFIFIWDVGFFKNRKLDFIILKFFNKKIITLFCGDDIRSPQAYRKFSNDLYGDSFINYLVTSDGYGSAGYERKKRLVAEQALKYSDLILNYPVDNLSAVGKVGVPFPYIIDETKYEPRVEKFRDLSLLKIVHAPSNTIVKGTPLVRAAIKRLQIEGYKFEYIELTNKPNEYVIQTLSNSHILLNQFYGFAPGLLGIEGMLLGNVVLMSADPEIEQFPHDFSAMYMKTRYWEVYDNLKYLLDNPQVLESIAARARKFILENYSIPKSAEAYHRILREKGIEV